jgi:hypothetical protein
MAVDPVERNRDALRTTGTQRELGQSPSADGLAFS